MGLVRRFVVSNLKSTVIINYLIYHSLIWGFKRKKTGNNVHKITKKGAKTKEKIKTYGSMQE